MRVHSGLGLAALVLLSGGCLQILGYQDTTAVDPGTGGGGAGGGSAHCADGKKDGDEAGLDCGGSCSKCAPGMGCANGADCTSLVCGPGGTCLAPACDDKVENGAESDIDCGGATCGKCVAGGKCAAQTDCASGACANGICSATCSDGMKDGAESGVDCGGGCAGCKDGEACAANGDCGSGVCQGKACVSSYVWAHEYGDAQSQTAYSVTTDAAGNILLSGLSAGSIDFGSGPLVATSFHDIFLAKLDGSGKHVWSKTFANEDPQNTHSVTSDGLQNVFLTGTFRGGIDFGGGTVLSGGTGFNPFEAIYVTKFDAAGNYQWTTTNVPSSGSKFVPVDRSNVTGKIATTGSFNGTIDFGGGPMTSTGNDIFVLCLDEQGKHLWSKKFGEAGNQTSTWLAMDSYDVTITGVFDGAVDFGANPMTATTTSDAFIAKLGGLDGASVWSKHLSGASVTRPHIAVDFMGNIIVTGRFYGTLDFGGASITSLGLEDLFVVKLDAAGNHLWSKRFDDESPSSNSGIQVTTDSVGNVTITSTFTGTIDFGDGPRTSTDDNDLFVAKFDSSGKYLWSSNITQSGAHNSAGVAALDATHTIVAGTLFGKLDFGGGTLASLNYDVFLAKFLTP